MHTQSLDVTINRYALGAVAAIAIGHSFRSSIEAHVPASASAHRHIVIQPKDLTEDGRVEFDPGVVVAGLKNPERFALSRGDVIFQPRGVTYRAATTDARAPLPAIVAAPLYLIRGREDILDPSYLVAFLNSRETQAALRQSATGSVLPQVPRGALEALLIPVPSLDAQRRLGALTRLANERRRLEFLIHEKTLKLISAAALSACRQESLEEIQ